MDPKDKYYFFAHSHNPLSNFYAIGGNQANTSEKQFILAKANFFGDKKVAGFIKKAKSPQHCKRLGRKIKPFIQTEWNAAKYGIMLDVLRWKWDECEDFRDRLTKYQDRQFVEAATWDRIWGIGYHEESAMQNIRHWGQNLLGKALNEVAKEKI